MVTYENDDNIGKERFKDKASEFLKNLALELTQERQGAEFKISVSGYMSMDDSAKYVKLFQLGPERDLLSRKKRELASARVADYSKGFAIQLLCGDPTLEGRVVKGFEEIAKTEGRNEVFVSRYGYAA